MTKYNAGGTLSRSFGTGGGRRWTTALGRHLGRLAGAQRGRDRLQQSHAADESRVSISGDTRGCGVECLRQRQAGEWRRCRGMPGQGSRVVAGSERVLTFTGRVRRRSRRARSSSAIGQARREAAGRPGGHALPARRVPTGFQITGVTRGRPTSSLRPGTTPPRSTCRSSDHRRMVLRERHRRACLKGDGMRGRARGFADGRRYLTHDRFSPLA